MLMGSVGQTRERGRGLERIVSREAAPYWGLFCLALAIRLAHHAWMMRQDPLYAVLLPGGDNHTFDRWALEISQTFWLGYDRIPFFHGPLYPYFLGLIYLRFDYNHDMAFVCQHFLGAVTAVLIFHIGRHVFGKTAGSFAGLMAAFCPLFLVYEGEILSDSFILFVNVAMLAVLLRAGRTKTLGMWIAGGIMIGLSILGRPNTLLFIPVATLWCWLVENGLRRRMRAVTAMLLAAVITVAPATLANYFVGHRLCLVTFSGPVNVYIGNAPDANGTFATPPSYFEIVRNTPGQDPAKVDWSTHLRRAILNDPAILFRNLWKKTVLFWQSGEIPHNINFYLKQRFSPFLKTPVVFGVVAPVGLAGIAAAFAQRRHRHINGEATMLLGFLVVYSSSIIMVFVLDRLRFPALAVLMIFGGEALTQAVRNLVVVASREKVLSFRLRHAMAAVSILVAWGAMGLVLQSRDTSLLLRWNDHYNLAAALEDRGRFGEALEEYNAACQLAPQIVALKECRDRVEHQVYATR